MASNTRTCEQCGGKSSPHIPRQRVNGRMLCQGCAARESTRTAAKKDMNTGSGKAEKKPVPQEQFDFWEGELAPREDLHPLHQPLPNSVWEKYNLHRQLLGKPKTFLSGHLDDAEKRAQEDPGGDSSPIPGSRADAQQNGPKRRFWQRRKGSLGKTADKPEHSPLTEGVPLSDIQQHLHKDHGFSQGSIDNISAQDGASGLLQHHKSDHKSDEEHYHELKHTHASGEQPLPTGLEETKQHLQDGHGMADWEADLVGNDEESVQSHHDYLHSSTAENPDHSHAEGVAEKGTTGGGHNHSSMSHEELAQHILSQHGVKPKGLDYIHEHGSSGNPAKDLETWHTEHHDVDKVHGGSPHDHGGPVSVDIPEGPEQLKNPSKYTNSSLHGHLLEDHGIDPDHMEHAIDGTYEGTDPSHVVHMLHNAAHKSGQSQFPHEHENWNGGPELHPAHKDAGKPFWGAPPVMSKFHAHAMADKDQGGHGAGYADLPDTSGLPDEEASKVFDKWHNEMHQHGGEDLLHQHVPTAQPGVKTPKQIQKEQLQKHLEDYHGVLDAPNPQMTHSEMHDPDAFAYKAHPGHEHSPGDKHGPVTQELPSAYAVPPAENPGPGDYVSSKPFNPGHHEHPANMSKSELVNHLGLHHKGWTAGKNGGNPQPPSSSDFATAFLDDFGSAGKSHEQLLQDHALSHSTGESNGHTHEAVGGMSPLEDVNAHYGHEPEIQTDTHPAITTDHEALAHIIKHHPNVTDENLSDWQKSSHTGDKGSMVKYHDALHTPGSKTVMGNTLPKVLDGHDHADPVGVPTTIAVGHHLVHEHGVSQAKVAAMTPAEFKAHHEQLHLKKSEFDIGHGHSYPGGPQRDPRVALPNTHHQAMRQDDRHPAVQEWYHGTGTDYEGAPKNATELKEDHGFWGNFGGGDWNNHVGTHWTSLHQMAQSFNGSSNRVIHAKLHIANPVTYNSLNHMSHDAYDRMHESGHLQDGGEFYKNHYDDPGYDADESSCCAGRLLEYAKGHHRSDGKYGVEAFRDSLRASGYDGIHVRNQADTPRGHWNAIPLSADQIELTHGGCRGTHDDERDNDVREFENNRNHLLKGWDHPKRFDHTDYLGKKLDHLPDSEEVEQANKAKQFKPMTNKTAEGRGDSDPYLTHDPDDDNADHYCNHCEENTDHTSANCTVSKWCHVCSEHGNHEADDGTHPHCDHCEDYADHTTEECSENADNWSKEAYCPHCDQKSKDNEHASDCVNCGQKLPDWGSLATHGKAVKPEEYSADGETDAVNYGHAKDAKLQGGKEPAELAAHLYHHHKSDVGGPEFDSNGDWDQPALKHHHQWLHMNPEHAQEKGFTVDHTHKQMFGEFKKSLTPEETHSHMMLSHVGPQGGAGALDMHDVAKMTPEQAVEAHKKAHAADDAVKWGAKDSDGDLVEKVMHTHNLDEDPGALDEAHAPKGDALISHLQNDQYHMKKLPSPTVDAFEKHPGVAEALHKQLHNNHGPAAEPGAGTFHVHGPELDKQIAQHEAVKNHLVNDHGASPNHYSLKGQDTAGLMHIHNLEHNGSFPDFGKPDHTHFGGTAHQDPEGHSAATMKKSPANNEPQTPQKPQIKLKSPAQDKYGPGSVMHHIQHEHSGSPLDDLAGDVLDTAADHGEHAAKTNSHYLEMAKAHKAYHQEHGHPGHTHYDNEPFPKEAVRRTLTDLFEEVAL